MQYPVSANTYGNRREAEVRLITGGNMSDDKAGHHSVARFLHVEKKIHTEAMNTEADDICRLAQYFGKILNGFERQKWGN